MRFISGYWVNKVIWGVFFLVEFGVRKGLFWFFLVGFLVFCEGWVGDVKGLE